jgi:hypothetical protein
MTSSSTPARPGLRTTALLAVPLALVGVVGTATRHARASNGYTLPQSSGLEQATGVRIKALKVVGDHGIVQLDYDVIDPEKATRFQSDTQHPPRIKDTQHQPDGLIWRAAVMKQGHSMRAGQTYYVLYQNSGGAVQAGDVVTITYGPITVPHVPVE